MVVSHHHPNNVGCNQTDEIDQTHIGHDDGAGQAAQHHIRKGQPLHMDAQADSGFLPVQQGVVIPTVGEAVNQQDQHHDAHGPQVLPPGAAQVAKSPENQTGQLDLVGKILNQRGSTAEHGADGHTRQNDSLRRHLLEPGQPHRCHL